MSQEDQWSFVFSGGHRVEVGLAYFKDLKKERSSGRP